ERRHLGRERYFLDVRRRQRPARHRDVHGVEPGLHQHRAVAGRHLVAHLGARRAPFRAATRRLSGFHRSMERPALKIGAARPRLRFFWAAALAIATPLGRASADPVVATFTTVADATLFAESGDLASGADDGFFAGVNGNTGGFAERRALLKFDLSALPAGAEV